MSKALRGIIINVKLKSGTTAAVKEHAAHLVKGHKSHSAGTKFWAYSTEVGASNQYTLFAPFNNYSELDRPVTVNVLEANSEPAVAGSVLTKLESDLDVVDRTLVEYVPGLSNHPKASGAVPGPYLFVVKLQLKPGFTRQAREAAEKLLHAHKNSAKGLQFWTYSSTSGSSETYYVFIPFSKYADLDQWPTTGGLFAESVGTSEADKTLTTVDSFLASSERSILTYLPGYSNPA